MKPRIATLALSCLLLMMVGACQSAKLRLPDFQPLADKATDSVNISISPSSPGRVVFEFVSTLGPAGDLCPELYLRSG